MTTIFRRSGQCIPADLPDTLRRRLAELTVNVLARPLIRVADNGGEFTELAIERATAVASTSTAASTCALGDSSKPVLGDEVMAGRRTLGAAGKR